jgi:xanthine dehydrogenase accessory factor
MSDLIAILNAYCASQQLHQTALLATVVHTQGSTYRRPGARMLMTADGQQLGMVSGGCLENDIWQHGQQVTQVGKPRVVTYDTTIDEDIQWGFGLGCNGVVQVLIEQLDRGLINPLIYLDNCWRDRLLRVLATVFAVEGTTSIKLGQRLVLHPDDTITTDITEDLLQRAIATDAKLALQQTSAFSQSYQLPTGQIQVLFEVLQPPPHLTIFGAGHDALPVLQFAKAIGWEVTVVDCRAREATRQRFSQADQVYLVHRPHIFEQITINAQMMAVVMTHNYLDDLAILRVLLSSQVRYIGVLGPKHRTNRLIIELSTEIKIESDRLYAPVGLDIGANTPQEIAIAIIAEIQAVLSNHSAGFLKQRTGSIH